MSSCTICSQPINHPIITNNSLESPDQSYWHSNCDVAQHLCHSTIPVPCPECDTEAEKSGSDKQKRDKHRYLKRYMNSKGRGRARLKPGYSGAKQRGAKEEFSGASAALVKRLHARFRDDMSYLLSKEPRFQKERKKNLQASNDLQLKMKHGSVKIQDFRNPGALWGYCQHKMTKRALLAFEAFRIGAKVMPKLSQLEPLIVASIGGGCGNDLYGFTLFRDLCCCNGDMEEEEEEAKEDHAKRKEDCNASPSTIKHNDKLLLFDFVSEEWSPIVHKLGECLQRSIPCLPCDVQQPLVGVERNADLLRECVNIDLFLFSFVLHEAQNWSVFLTELWTRAKDGALFYFKDPSDWQEKKILQHFEQLKWIEGHDYFWVVGDGLLCVKRSVVGKSSSAIKDDRAAVAVAVEEVEKVEKVEKEEEEEESLPYAGEEYWNKRYDAHSDAYDWLIKYSHFKEQGLNSFIEFEDKILMLGCGNAQFSPDLYDDGYCHIQNIDLSPTVIQQMSEEHKLKNLMKWEIMNCCQLLFDKESFDVVLDKSTMDCLCCCENSVHQISEMMKESWRCLCPGGLFISLSFHAKERVISCIQYDEDGCLIGWSDIECFLIPNPKVERGEEATPAHYVCVVAIKPSEDE